jgi:hypothetical protein
VRVAFASLMLVAGPSLRAASAMPNAAGDEYLGGSASHDVALLNAGAHPRHPANLHAASCLVSDRIALAPPPEAEGWLPDAAPASGHRGCPHRRARAPPR